MPSVEDGVLLKHAEKTAGLRGLLKELNVNMKECEVILAEAEKSLSPSSPYLCVRGHFTVS